MLRQLRFKAAYIGAALVLTLQGLAAGSHALATTTPVTFFDGTFNAADWTATVIENSSGGSFSSAQVTSGGNPGAYRRTSHSLPGLGSLYVAHSRSSFNYNPATQGALVSVQLNCDLRHFNPPSGQAVAYAALVVQGNTYYRSGFVSTFLNSWVPFTLGPSTNAAFVRVSGPGPSSPDFSASGGPMVFGFVSANGNSGGNPLSRTSGIDNFSMVLQTNPPPTLNAPTSVLAECTAGMGATVTMNVSASDPNGDAMTVRLKIDGTTVDTESLTVAGGAVQLQHYFPMGTTLAVVELTDGANTVASNVSVTVSDTTAATLSIIGPLETTVEAGGAYSDPGATATDACCGDLTALIMVTGLQTGDLLTPGEFSTVYSVTDPCNGFVTTQVRLVHVVDTTPPTISPNLVDGNIDLSIPAGTPYQEAGATATDLVDGNVTVSIVGEVNWQVPGIYTIEYHAADAHNNTSVAYRSVTVLDTVPPVIDSFPAEVQVSANATLSGAVPDVTALVLAHDGVSATVTIEQDIPAGTMVTGMGDSTVVTVTVRDQAGNSTTCQMRIRLIADLDGFSGPLAGLVPEGQTPPLPANSFKASRVVPLKMLLTVGGQPLAPGQAAAPQIVQVIRNGTAIPLEVLDLDPGASNDNGVQFRWDDPSWKFNLKTQGWATGNYVITVQLPDGRRMVGAFVLR